MGICNYCSLRDIRKGANSLGKIATTVPGSLLDPGNPETSLSGTSVYIHDPRVDITDLVPKALEKLFAAWFMELTDECAC